MKRPWWEGVKNCGLLEDQQKSGLAGARNKMEKGGRQGEVRRLVGPTSRAS